MNSLIAKDNTYDNTDSIGVLDVDISSRLILDEILGINDFSQYWSGSRGGVLGGGEWLRIAILWRGVCG